MATRRHARDAKDARVDLNTASVRELARIPGMDEERAQDLVDHREEYGEFDGWEDVHQVPGFSDRVIQELRKAAEIR